MTSSKRNITIIAVLLCVCVAVYLNWSYNHQNEDKGVFSGAELAGAKAAEELAANGELSYISDYFAEARLTRQQSRDEALALLETAATSGNASQETIDGAMSSIAAMASYSMQESQIENMLLAKNFTECLAFMSADGIVLAVPASSEGLTVEEVAKITDAVIAETNFSATQIKIIEVRAPAPSPTPASPMTDDGEKKTDGLVPDADAETDANSSDDGLIESTLE